MQSLPTGKVTPKKLQVALNTIILPDLGITTWKPLCVQMACRWLIKLGWHNTLMKKGVYMDGHEHADVVEYRQQVFLPAMAEFERRMAHYEGPELKCVAPNLAPANVKSSPNSMMKAHFMLTRNHTVPGFKRMNNHCGKKVAVWKGIRFPKGTLNQVILSWQTR